MFPSGIGREWATLPRRVIISRDPVASPAGPGDVSGLMTSACGRWRELGLVGASHGDRDRWRIARVREVLAGAAVSVLDVT